MSLETMSLDGSGWSMNYFRPTPKLAEGEFPIVMVCMKDGESAGAAAAMDTQKWWPVTVPCDVRDGLVANGQMEDPYFGRNSDRSRWVESFEWWFRREVIVPESWSGRRVYLLFHGVDCHARYYWDGQQIGESKDMFIPVRIELPASTTPGTHILAVRISPLPACTPNHFKQEVPDRAHFHKMQCAWGWDWAREITGMGIWDRVELQTTGPVRIEDVFVQAVPDSDTSANLHIELTAENSSEITAWALRILTPEGKEILHKEIPVKPESKGDSVYRHEERLNNIRLWWPNGYGEQPIYRADVTLYANGKMSDRKEVSFGIREIRMERNEDSPDEAYPLTFVVNGVKIYGAGANWSPTDLLPSRIDRARYERLLGMVKNANMTLLRIWGGGLVEKKDFYDLCDQMGILVWQEFQLSCSNYPTDEVYLQENAIEAESIIRRLRNHPCIALWCGGNELMYYGVTPEHPVLSLFGKLVEKYHPGTAYHLSCPDKSRPGERDHGPWTYEPHANWNKHDRLLNSEFGCTAPVGLDACRRFIPEEECYPDSESMKHHFWMEHYYGADEFEPQTLSDKMYYAQFAQADTMSYILGVYRSRQFHASGAMMWAYNSSWPEHTYSVVDYYGNPKMAYYWLNKPNQVQTLVVKDEGWSSKTDENLLFTLYAINGLSNPLSGHIRAEIWHADGTCLFSETRSVTVEPGGVSKPWELGIPAAGVPEGVLLLRTTLISNEGETIVVLDRLYSRGPWAKSIRDLPASLLKVSKISDNVICVTNIGQSVAMMLELRGEDALLSENFFHLSPGCDKKIRIISCKSGKDLSLFSWNKQIR